MTHFDRESSFDSPRPISNGVRTVQQIYDTYRIMPALQLHQLRVAAVAKTLCENSTRDVDKEAAVLVCLFHDMGNIIKSDMTTFPEFLEPEGRAHWEMVKQEFIRKYGHSEHDATRAIVRELILGTDVQQYIDGIGFSKLASVCASTSFELKFCQYGDLRVGPHGVLSMPARMEEGKGRYRNKHPDVPRSAEEWENLSGAAYELERQVFAEMDIAPEDITEQTIAPLIPALRDYKV